LRLYLTLKPPSVETAVHAARLLLLLDMVLDHLGEHGHFGVEVIIFGWVPL